MTTELEKQFFDTFGIEPKKVTIWNSLPCYACEEYPQITDKHYLELICLLNKLIDEKYNEYETFISFDYKNLKEEILRECLIHREELKHQVQAIFEVEE